MTVHRIKAAGPVRVFFGRLALQIVLSGTAMGAIHFGMRVVPEVGSLLVPPAATIAAIESPAVRIAVPSSGTKAQDEPAPPATAPAASLQADAPPLPQAAPPRSDRMAQEAAQPSRAKVQRFDACVPACPSRDPLLRREIVLAVVDPVGITANGRGTDYPEFPDDGLEDRSASLLDAPGQALNAAGRTTRTVWNRVETLLPF